MAATARKTRDITRRSYGKQAVYRSWDNTKRGVSQNSEESPTVRHTVATHGTRLHSAETGYGQTLSQSVIICQSLARYEIHRQTIFKKRRPPEMCVGAPS
jgi:hypothetical protein